MTFPGMGFYSFLFQLIGYKMVLPICGETLLFFVIIGGETNSPAAYNQLVKLKSKTYCQNITL
jgi:hypothetical protein